MRQYRSVFFYALFFTPIFLGLWGIERLRADEKGGRSQGAIAQSGEQAEDVGKQNDEISNLSFYYFRTTVNAGEIKKATSLKIKPAELTFRLFDVDLKRQIPLPVSPLSIDADEAKTIQEAARKISGLVFITNRTLKSLGEKEIPALARNILRKVGRVSGPLSLGELQIDCDWSGSTRKKYFRLLRHLAAGLEGSHMTLAATIRLHQVKYRERTGVPPVSKGILMLYNMDDPAKWETQNSVFDLETARLYFGRLHEYPLALDIAIPMFSQVVIFNTGRVKGLIRGDLEPALNNPECFEKISERRYRALNRCLLQNIYGAQKEIASGSYLRFETPDPDEVKEALKLVLQKRGGIQRLFIYDFHSAVGGKVNSNVLDHALKELKHTGHDQDNRHNKIRMQTLREYSNLFGAHRLFVEPGSGAQ